MLIFFNVGEEVSFILRIFNCVEEPHQTQIIIEIRIFLYVLKHVWRKSLDETFWHAVNKILTAWVKFIL